MASVYDYHTGDVITVALQGSSVCNEAIRTAVSIATGRRAAVVLDDDDGPWYIGPRGGVRRLTRQEKFDGGWEREEEDEEFLVDPFR